MSLGIEENQNSIPVISQYYRQESRKGSNAEM
jgi:hypothetical protein